MIDTIKFKILVPQNLLIHIEGRSTEYKGYDHKNERVTYQIFKAQIPVGSFEYKISIFLDSDGFFVELSIPKYLHDHNILLLPCEDIIGAFNTLRMELQRFFKCVLPVVDEWQLYRVDFCYAWKFYDDTTALRVIEYLKNRQYKRKKLATYESSAMFVGTESSAKFYMKGPEVYRHDFKRIKLRDIDYASNLLDLARGVVRFEVTYRRRKIEREFGGRILFEVLFSRDNIYNILQKELYNILGTAHTSMNTAEAFDRFRQYPATKALKLYFFYRALLSPDPTDKLALKQIPYSTRQRYKAIINKLHLGIPEEHTRGFVDLSIPSAYSVGDFPRVHSNTRGTSQF